MWVQDLRRKPLYFIPIIRLLDRSHRVADSGLASIRVLDWIMHFVAQKIYATLSVVAAWNISLGHIPERSGIERPVSRLRHHQIINFGMASIHIVSIRVFTEMIGSCGLH
jgi:hypothetical protein